MPSTAIPTGSGAVKPKYRYGNVHIRKINSLLFALLWLLSIAPARPEKRPKIGLVLGGGGAKGIAHIPVLKLLDELEFPVDFIAGASAGGIAGGLYAAGYSGAEIEAIFAAADWGDLFSDRPERELQPFFEKRLDGRYQLELPLRRGGPTSRPGLLSGQKFLDRFSALLFPLAADIDFSQLAIPFCCLAVDIVNGKPVVLKSGSLARALRATMSIPTLLAPVEWDGYLLVDGGLLNNLPIEEVEDMGADIIIAVDLSTPLSPREEIITAEKVLGQSLQIVESAQKEEKLAKVDLLIWPDLKGLSSTDYFFPDRVARIKQKGEEAAQKARPALLELQEKYGLRRSRQSRRPSINPNDKRLLGRVLITGNEKIPAAFIANLFGLKPGDPVDAGKISRQINELYALGYFENIQYDIYPGEGDTIDIRLVLRELPRAGLRLGLHYNGYRNLVAAAGLYATNFPVAGLRLENEFEVAGLTRLSSRVSYPTKTLDFPVYPLLYMRYKDVPTRLYGGSGEVLTSYRDRSFLLGGGLGFLLKKSLNLELSYEQEWMNMRSQPAFAPLEPLPKLKSLLRKFVLAATIDSLDDLRLPRDGVYIQGRYEGSYQSFGSDAAYEVAELSADVYTTFLEKNTLRLSAYWGESRGELPFYKQLNQGHPNAFVGMGYDQLRGNAIKILRGEFRYAYTSILQFKFMANIAFDFEQHWPGVTFAPGSLWGTGAGVVIDSPLGPLELVFSLGSKGTGDPNTLQAVSYLELGARF